jgi:hypothetical protein
MRRKNLREYGLRGYVRTDAPKEWYDAYLKRYGCELCPLRTLQYWFRHGLRERLPFDWLDDVAPWDVVRPEDRYGDEVEVVVTVVKSGFPLIAGFAAVIVTSQQAHAAQMRTRLPARTTQRLDVTAPSTSPPLPAGTLRTL